MSSAEFVKMNLKEHLGQTLVPHVADGLWSLYDNARELCERNQQLDQTLRTFQNLLTRIPQWSDETLATEVERIVEASGCEYMDDLLMGVFLAYIRAFASIQYRGESAQVNLDFERPSVSKFIHEFYKHSARAAWKSAYLFKTHGITSEQQARNRRDIEILIDKCMTDVINAFIPWKEISRAYFQAPPPAPEPTPEPPKEEKDAPRAVSFGELSDEEDDDADSHVGERPAISLGEDLEATDLGVEEPVEDTQEVNLDTIDTSDTLVLKL
jgi:hypothetical protein